MRSISFRSFWSTRPPSVYQPLTPWCTPSSMNCGIPALVCQTRVTPMERQEICRNSTTSPYMVCTNSGKQGNRSNTSRIVDRTSPKPATGPATHPRCIGLPWSRFRIAELQAIDEGSNVGKVGLSPSCQSCEIILFNRAAWFLNLPAQEHTAFRPKSNKMESELGVEIFGRVCCHVYATFPAILSASE
jgi:hypothetical protein